MRFLVLVSVAILAGPALTARAARIQALAAAEREFAALPEDPGRDLILNSMRDALLDPREVRMWEKNPDLYSSGVTNSIFVIMSRNFAPAAERLQSVIVRERQFPALFAAARANLRNPPPIYTQLAMEQAPRRAAARCALYRGYRVHIHRCCDQSFESRQQLHVFLGHRFQRIAGPAPGAQASGDHVRIETSFP
jgi:hypothetical protein